MLQLGEKGRLKRVWYFSIKKNNGHGKKSERPFIKVWVVKLWVIFLPFAIFAFCFHKCMLLFFYTEMSHLRLCCVGSMVAAQVRPCALWRTSPCGSCGWRGSLFRIYELLTFTIHMQVKCEHFFLTISEAIKAPINSGDLRANHRRLQLIRQVHMESTTLFMVLPSSIESALCPPSPSPPGASGSTCRLHSSGAPLKSGAGLGTGNRHQWRHWRNLACVHRSGKNEQYATKHNSFTWSFLWLILMSLKKGFYFNQVLR